MFDAALSAPPQAHAPPGDLRATLDALHGDAWRWALFCCRGDREAAHDALHDAYVRILEGRARFSGEARFKTWAFGVIRVTAMASRRRRLFLDILFEPIGAHAEPAADNAPAGGAPKLAAAIAALPRRQREVVMLAFGHDLTVEEAAGVMAISVGAARQHHARAKQTLRAALEPDPEQSHG